LWTSKSNLSLAGLCRHFFQQFQLSRLDMVTVFVIGKTPITNLHRVFFNSRNDCRRQFCKGFGKFRRLGA
jgi:hypothetical protein